MAKDPRPQKPGSSEPDEALDLLRALARTRPGQPSSPPGSADAGQPEDKLDALRELAEKLDLQLRGPPAGAAAPGPLPAATPPSAAPFPPGRPASAEEPMAGAHESRTARMRATLSREWRALGAALPERHTLVPRFNRAQLVHVAASIAVLVIAAIGGMVVTRTARTPAPAPAPTAAPSADVVPQLAPAAPGIDLTSITKAMSECDAEASRQPDQLHFLVLPLLPAKAAENDWRSLALQEVGNTFLLLSAKDALDGLRDGKLVVRRGRYTFSVLDSAGGATFSWTSATDISRLSKPVGKDVKSLRLSFDFSAAQTGGQWSNEFPRAAGTCYWVSVLVRQ
jgi:hypothetical protein